MYHTFPFLSTMVLMISNCSTESYKTNTDNMLNDTVTQIEMRLDAFGVESDSFPSIDATINLSKGIGICKKSFYNPTFKDTLYTLNKEEIEEIKGILKKNDLKQLKKEYKVEMSDQPTSILTLRTNATQLTIRDYGLNGPNPLRELYKIVYKF